ncbi:hypothetical protein E0K89_014955, partial [Aquicoccus sp. SCR17]|nr:hypothetical protein [Carideicomes alvinocaridis]
PAAPPAASTTPAAPISRAALAAAVPVENPAFDEDEPETGTPGDRRPPKTARDLERERMTVFGARRQDQIGGKPRYLGLMLTLALLLFLAGVFAWASVFMEDGLARFFGSDEPVVAALPEAAGDDPTTGSTPTMPAASETAPTGDDTTQSADRTTPPAQTDQPPAQSELAAELAPEPEPEPQASADPVMIRPEEDAPALPDPIRSEAISSEEAQARYAATGVWQRAPQPPQAPGGSEGTADIYVASIDRDVPSQDAIALPGTDAMMEADEPPEATFPPPPPGVRYRVDDRGLIVPSEDGIVAPGGYTLYSGQPGILPRPRPGSAAPATPEGEALPAENAPILASPEAAELIDIRPRLRPETLVEDNERVQLGGRSRDELATLRPRLRPEDLAPAPAVAAAETGTPEEPRVSEASGIAAQAMADAVAEAGEVELEEDFEAASDQAVAASLAPRARPGNMGSIVREAETTAPQQVAQAPRAVQPSIPSSASVARQATVENAINLRRINLIGVYGKPSNRRALVRLPNGRYEKVAVGDRIDGGRVAAIGETELRYVKGGRSLLLKMPNG